MNVADMGVARNDCCVALSCAGVRCGCIERPTPGPREVEDRGLLSEIIDLHDRSGQTYGSAAHATLRRRGILLYHPERDDAEAADRVTEDLLRVLGPPPDQAHEICQRPLPALDGRP